MAKLKLVYSNKTIIGKRPVQSFYYTGTVRRPTWAVKVAHSTTPERAAIAAFKRMINEPDIKGVHIYDASQARKFTLERRGQAIDVKKIGR